MSSVIRKPTYTEYPEACNRVFKNLCREGFYKAAMLINEKESIDLNMHKKTTCIQCKTLFPLSGIEHCNACIRKKCKCGNFRLNTYNPICSVCADKI